MRVKNKKIGIWGFGTVGKAAVNYLHTQDAHLQVMDSRQLADDEQQWLAQQQIRYCSQQDVDAFLQHNDLIVPSPGIDLRPYRQFAHKWLAELDLFDTHFNKPIIAITGSIGKTTVTHILSHLLPQHGFHVCTGGNIGVGMLSFLNKNTCHGALLEVSSFQLEHCTSFAPDLAIITNFYPNHLDRHGTEQEYLAAKLNIIKRQTKEHCALLPLALAPQVYKLNPQSSLCFFKSAPPTQTERKSLRAYDTLLWLENGNIVINNNLLIPAAHIPENFFSESWLIVYGVLHILRIAFDSIQQEAHDIEPLEHRLEKVATINNIDFYNDSKSTTPQSALAAVNRLRNKPIHLLLGGLSKGVDRTDLIKNLRGNVKNIYCFGTEAQQLARLCQRFNINHEVHKNMNTAFAACTQHAQPGDIILLSPAGSSFDLFKNYQERGKMFKAFVNDLICR